MSFEEVLNKTGWGLYSKFVIGVTSLGFFSAGFASMSVPLLLPVLFCDANISEKNLLYGNFSFSIGMAIGGLLLSSAADFYGRKILFSTTLVVIFISCLSAGFAHEFAFLCLTILCLGAGLTSNLNVSRINLMETLPLKRRERYSVLCDIFYTLGNFIYLGVYVTVMIYKLDKKPHKVTSVTFRIMYGLSGSLAIMVACASSLLQLSPRFLLMQKKIELALYALRHIYCMNTSQHWEKYNIKKDELTGLIANHNLETFMPHMGWIEQVHAMGKRILKVMIIVIVRQYRQQAVVIIFLKIGIMLSIFMMNNSLAKVVIKKGKGNCTLRAMDFLHIDNYVPDCKFLVRRMNYLYFVIIGVNILSGQVVLMIIIVYFDKRLIIGVCCFLNALCGMCLAFLKLNTILHLVLAAFIMQGYSILHSCINVIVIEAFPTAVRGTAFGYMQLLSSLSCAFTKLVFNMTCTSSCIIMTISMIAMVRIVYFLSKQKGSVLNE